MEKASSARIESEQAEKKLLKEQLEMERSESTKAILWERDKHNVDLKEVQTKLDVSLEESRILTADLVAAYHEVEKTKVVEAQESTLLKKEVERLREELLLGWESHARDKDEVARLVKTLLVRWKN